MRQRRAAGRLLEAISSIGSEATAFYRITARFVSETIGRLEGSRQGSTAQKVTSQEDGIKSGGRSAHSDRHLAPLEDSCVNAIQHNSERPQSLQSPSAQRGLVHQAQVAVDVPGPRTSDEEGCPQGGTRSKLPPLSTNVVWADKRIRSRFRNRLVDVLQDWELNALLSTSTTHDLLNTAQAILEQLSEEGTVMAGKAARSLDNALQELGIDLHIDKQAISVSENPIENFVRVRQISQLVHFTRVENVLAIANEGILSNKQLKGMGRAVLDPHRHDGRSNYVCTSISFPNYQMLYRHTHGNTSDWCVISIKPRIMWTSECLFYPYNAASADLAFRPSSDFLGEFALRQMFADSVCSRGRHACLPENYTTSPQAEVLVPSAIPPEQITAIGFSNNVNADKFRGILESVSISSLCSRELFKPRCDYEQWRRP